LRTVILVPVLGRPHRVQPLLDSITANTKPAHRVLFIVNDTDRAELQALRRANVAPVNEGPGPHYVTVPAWRGTYPCKINVGYQVTDEPLVFSAADDVAFHPGWLEAAQAKLSDQIDVVGTADLLNPAVMSGEHSTHTLFRRSYIEREGGTVDGNGIVLHEGYPHDFCDAEFIETAKQRGRFVHAPDSVVEHIHHWGGKAPMDKTYRRGRRGRNAGKVLYEKRRKLWT
jgi:hypothetical protein